MKYRIKETTKAGIVVHIIFLMCLNKSDSPIAAAKFVESDKGDILSPKIAPEMIAPATNAGLTPIVIPIPNNAIPTVEIKVNALPIDSPIIAQTTKTDGTKNLTLIKLKPQIIKVGIIPAAIQVAINDPIRIKIKMGINPVLIPSLIPA